MRGTANMNLLRQNYNILIEKQPQLQMGIDIEKDVDIKDVFCGETDTKKMRLQSCGDMKLPAEIWCDQFENIHYDTVFVIFGLGYYTYISLLHKKYPDNIIVIYEPSVENIIYQFSIFDWTNVLDNDNIMFVCGEDRRRDLALILHNLICKTTINPIQYGRIPNYCKIWDEEYTIFFECVKETCRANVINRNTLDVFGQYMATNYLYNLGQFFKGSGINNIYDAMQKYQYRDYPAVIISAGPSLEKNIDELKKYKNRAFVICVDAALRAAQNHGIEPDLVVSVDPTMGNGDGYIIDIKRDYPFIIHLNSSTKLVQNIKGRKFYTCNEDFYLKDLLEQYEKNLIILETGGSVANTAFTFARLMEFKTIILIGQDLAYPNNQFHASGCFEDEGEVDTNDSKRYFYVESVDGSKVITEENMDKYRLWFQEQIAFYPGLNVIDATEGGALIKGTEIMRLRDALKKVCPKHKMNFRKIIDSADRLFDEKQQQKINQEIISSKDKIDEHINYIESNRKNYQKLKEYNNEKRYNTNEFNECINSIKEFTHFMETEKEMELFRMYVSNENFEMRRELQEHKELIIDEINRIADAGIRMIDAYIKAGEKLKLDWNKALEIE